MTDFISNAPAQNNQALSDIDIIEQDLQALRDIEASAENDPPSNPEPGMWWQTSDTNKLFKRNQANTQWMLMWFESVSGNGYGPAWYYPTSEDSSPRNLNTHLNSYITSAVAVHGIKQGSGNGLDADKLDGQHASAFSIVGHNHPGNDITSAVANATDADKVDGIHASTTAQANKLLALDGNSKLPASITGEAASIANNSVSQAKIQDGAVPISKMKKTMVVDGTTYEGALPLSITLDTNRSHAFYYVSLYAGGGSGSYTGIIKGSIRWNEDQSMRELYIEKVSGSGLGTIYYKVYRIDET